MATNYEVVSQRDGVEPDGAGSLANVRVITFKALPSNQPGTVKVPLANLTPDVAAAALSAAADTVNAIQAL